MKTYFFWTAWSANLRKWSQSWTRHKWVPERSRASALQQIHKQSTKEQSSEKPGGDDTPWCKALKMKGSRKELRKIFAILNYRVVKWHKKSTLLELKMESEACGKSSVKFIYKASVSELEKNPWSCTFSGGQEIISDVRNKKERQIKREKNNNFSFFLGGNITSEGNWFSNQKHDFLI